MVNVLDKVQPKNKTQLKRLIDYAFKHNIYDLNFIDTSKITNMSNLFMNCEYDIDVSNWDVSNVTTTFCMFVGCKKFNSDLSNWDVSNVKNMNNMFYCCKNFDCDLSNWNVSNVTDMYSMFTACENFKGKGIENWDVSNVTDMRYMFYNCKNFNCDLSNWDMSNALRINEMFYGCKNFEGKGLENWKLEKTLFYYNIFAECDKVKLPSWYKAFLKRCNLEFV